MFQHINLFHISNLFLLQLFQVYLLEGNPGECPVFPIVSARHESCFEKSNCDSESDCKRTERCCENPCGINKCYETKFYSATHEKCPNIVDTNQCEESETLFCYIEDCSRCCQSRSSCNPAPGLLQTVEICKKVMCSQVTCQQRGSECTFVPTEKKTQCVCSKKRCSTKRNYMCVDDRENTRTFINECNLNKTACQQEKDFLVLYKGICTDSKTSGLLSPTTYPRTVSSANRRRENLQGLVPNLCSKKKCASYETCELNWFTNTPYCGCKMTCSLIPHRVCGTDTNWYINECMMRAIACKSKRVVEVDKENKCTHWNAWMY